VPRVHATVVCFTLHTRLYIPVMAYPNLAIIAPSPPPLPPKQQMLAQHQHKHAQLFFLSDAHLSV
jgi:hypothetical protein